MPVPMELALHGYCPELMCVKFLDGASTHSWCSDLSSGQL